MRLRRLATRALLGASALAVLLALHQWLTWPDVGELAARAPETTAFIERYQRQRRAAGESDAVAWRWVPYQAIDDDLKHAVLVAEDIDFFSHDGFAVDQIRAAVRETLKQGQPLRGASTISQQVAKNLWLSPSRNPWRKVKEALLTRQLERHLSKRRILELYLNVVELGPGVFGAEAAARRYFGTGAGDLSRRQAAALAAALPRPATWHPGADSAAYRAHVERILGRMERSGWIRKEL